MVIEGEPAEGIRGAGETPAPPRRPAPSPLKPRRLPADEVTMLPTTYIQGAAMIFLGLGAIGASKVALYFSEPNLSLGYLIGAVLFIMVDVTRLLRFG